jgi:hypothetical protein
MKHAAPVCRLHIAPLALMGYMNMDSGMGPLTSPVVSTSGIQGRRKYHPYVHSPLVLLVSNLFRMICSQQHCFLFPKALK